ncbi:MULTISPECIES: phage distal tail protein [Streptomyces]|uniref:phage distal tail protein n=1 Tax=Streptomyces TaxID=1883 RepID=UPI00163C346D|nr:MULTISPECIES: phage tail domain-containing protein [Streptomyces]MBC2877435.1 phage tail family protein [Streptomyces sp. TYQ1024]UBI38233.1 phage tail family protein [Streptomyces mobaraensis]UKW30819.1 phage tail family protein [Streptomyces sp. TYQ1024]
MPPTPTLPLLPDAGTDQSPGSLITQDGQVQWAGILFGPGTDYPIADSGLTGWADLPGLDSGDVLRPDQHGAWPGAQWAQSRIVSAPVWLLPGSLDLTAEVVRRFRAATAVDSTERWLAVRLHGETLACRARVNQRVIPHDRMFVTRGTAKATVQWVCADPRRLTVEERAATTGLPVAERGLAWGKGLSWPLQWGQAGSSGLITVVNTGDAPASPVVTFRGPLRLPSLTRIDDGTRLEYDIALAPSDTLTVDTSAGTVLLNGSASRIHTATTYSAPEQTFLLAPGDTAFAFRCAPETGGTGASVTVTWRSSHW